MNKIYQLEHTKSHQDTKNTNKQEYKGKITTVTPKFDSPKPKENRTLSYPARRTKMFVCIAQCNIKEKREGE